MFGNLRELVNSSNARFGGGRIPPKGVYSCKLLGVTFSTSRTGREMVNFKWRILKVVSLENLEELQKAQGFRNKEIEQKFVIEGSEIGLENFARQLLLVCDSIGIDADAYKSKEDMEVLFSELDTHTIILDLVLGPSKDPRFLRAYPAPKRHYSVPSQEAPVKPAVAKSQDVSPAPQHVEESALGVEEDDRENKPATVKASPTKKPSAKNPPRASSLDGLLEDMFG